VSKSTTLGPSQHEGRPTDRPFSVLGRFGVRRGASRNSVFHRPTDRSLPRREAGHRGRCCRPLTFTCEQKGLTIRAPSGLCNSGGWSGHEDAPYAGCDEARQQFLFRIVLPKAFPGPGVGHGAGSRGLPCGGHLPIAGLTPMQHRWTPPRPSSKSLNSTTTSRCCSAFPFRQSGGKPSTRKLGGGT
jgi:hypothetical protein